MILKHSCKKIPVHFVSDQEISASTGRVLEQGEYLYGLYSGKRGAILINKETPNNFSTLVHEIMEYIKNDYGLDGFQHEHLSTISEVLAQILEENWKQISRRFSLRTS